MQATRMRTAFVASPATSARRGLLQDDASLHKNKLCACVCIEQLQYIQKNYFGYAA